MTTLFPVGTVFGLLTGSIIPALASATWEHTGRPETQQPTPNSALSSPKAVGGGYCPSPVCGQRPRVNRQEAPGASLCCSCDVVTNL